MISSRALASEVVERAKELDATILCLVQVSPISWTHSRHLSKTLAARLPTATIYAANIEPGGTDAPFSAETAQLPVKKLFRDVKSIMDRIRETRFVKPDPQPVPAA